VEIPTLLFYRPDWQVHAGIGLDVRPNEDSRYQREVDTAIVGPDVCIVFEYKRIRPHMWHAGYAKQGKTNAQQRYDEKTFVAELLTMKDDDVLSHMLTVDYASCPAEIVQGAIAQVGKYRDGLQVKYPNRNISLFVVMQIGRRIFVYDALAEDFKAIDKLVADVKKNVKPVAKIECRVKTRKGTPCQFPLEECPHHSNCCGAEISGNMRCENRGCVLHQ